MGVDLRQVVAGVLTLTMFVMLIHMIKRDHFDAVDDKLPGTEDVSFESTNFDTTHVRKNIGIWKGDGDELKPCWLKPSEDNVDQTEGFVTFSLTNGPEYHISQIADAVLVARSLGATLVIPDIRGSQPGDKRNFEDIYDVDVFMKSMEGVVRVLKDLPSHVSTHKIAAVKVPNRVTEDYIAQHVEPIYRSKGSVRLATYFPSINMRKAGEKSDAESVACLAMYGSLELQQETHDLVDSMVERLRTLSRKSDGQFIAVDLRVEMLDKKGCQKEKGREERLYRVLTRCLCLRRKEEKMSENLMEKVSALGERLKIGGVEVGRKMSEGMSSMSFKLKEFFQPGPNQADKLVEDATSEALDEPDWALNLDLCDLVNTDKLNCVELVRGIKKRIILKSPRVQYLALVLLETLVKNCEKAFSEVAAERVLDEMVKLIDDPQTVVNNRNKALMMIEAWGESTGELRYLPVYEETYKSLRSRGIRFPGRDNESLAPIFTPPRSVSSAPEADVNLQQQFEHDIPEQFHHDVPVLSFTPEQTKEALDVARNSIELLSTVLSSSPQQDALQDDLTTTLVQQCRRSQTTVQRIVETAGDNEAVLFEALNVNDEIQKVLTKYEELKQPATTPLHPEPAMIPVAVEPDESPYHSKEDALIRKPAGSRTGVEGGSNDDMMDDLDEMIFGKKGGEASDGGHETKKQPSSKDDLISF